VLEEKCDTDGEKCDTVAGKCLSVIEGKCVSQDTDGENHVSATLCDEE
jgi:hypothetical protein